MSYYGLESKPGTQKFHCPVSGTGEVCAGREECHRLGGVRQDAKRRIVRIRINEEKLRTFAALPKSTPIDASGCTTEAVHWSASMPGGRSRLSVGAPPYARA